MFTLLNNFRLDSPASGGATGNGRRRLSRPRLKSAPTTQGGPRANSNGTTKGLAVGGDERETTDNGW
jgi:hypothetical protein